MAVTIPSDVHATGDAGHTTDHNNIADVLALAFGINVKNTAYAGGAKGDGTTDDTAAFQAAINAAVAVPAGTVTIPPGTYKITAGLAITGPVRILGTGVSATGGGTTAPAVVLNHSGTQGFTFPFQGYLWAGLEIGNFAISYTGTGDVFHQLNINRGYFHDLAITITGTGSSAIQTSGSVSVLNCQFDRVSVTTTSATRTVPMVTLSSGTSGSISNNTFWKCTFSNTGMDNTQYMIYIDCAGGAAAYHYMETFRDCWFEMPFGGAVKSLSGMALLIEACTTWDIFSGQGQTVGNSTYYIGAFPATGPGSQQSRITGCSRNRNGPNGSTTWDIFCEASTSGTIVEGYTVKPDTASTQTNAFFNFSAHPDIQVIGCVCPQGAAVNGNSTTVISNPGFSCTTIGAGASANTLDVVQAPFWTPLDSGYLAWTFDPALLIGAGTVLPATGQIQLLRVNVRRGITVTNVVLFLNSNGAALTTGQSFAGLYNSAGTLVGASADQATAWGSGAPKIVTAALAGGPYPLAAGFYWVAVLSNWTTTAPGFGRAQNFNATVVNAGTAASVARVGHYAAPNTSLPAITPASIVTDQLTIWAALS